MISQTPQKDLIMRLNLFIHDVSISTISVETMVSTDELLISTTWRSKVFIAAQTTKNTSLNWNFKNA